MCIENGEDKQNEHQQRVSSLAFSLVSIAPTVFINVLLANNISNLFEILSFALNVLSSSVECKREKIFLAQGRHITTYIHTHTDKPKCQSVLMMKMSLPSSSLSVFYRSTAIVISMMMMMMMKMGNNPCHLVLQEKIVFPSSSSHVSWFLTRWYWKKTRPSSRKQFVRKIG